MPAHIRVGAAFGDLYVKHGDYEYRRINDQWQLLANSGKWFDIETCPSDIKRQVEDYECCLRSYTFDEGPSYPQGDKKGNVEKFFRDLQAKELEACGKGIFKPVKLKYNAHAENMARFNREVAKRSRPIDPKHLTV